MDKSQASGGCCEVESRRGRLSTAVNRKAKKVTSRTLPVQLNHQHPDHSAQIKKLNRMIGQLEGVKRMIERRAYCPDILIQTRAASAALRAVELGILKIHVGHCVSDALSSPNGGEAEVKIEELLTVISRF